MPTAAQIAQGRNVPLSMGLVQALIKSTPLLASIDFRTSESTKFISLALIALPTAGAFVNYGEGFANSDAQLELREFDCSLVGGQVRAERITARKWDQTHKETGYTWFDLQMETKMVAQGIELEKQMIKGTSYDAKGFPGLKEMTPYIAANILATTETSAKYGFKRSVINAGGSTANTASSVYAIIEDPINGVQGVIGSDGQAAAGELFALTEMMASNEAPDATNAPTKKLIHDVQQFWGHIGLSLCGFNQSPNSVVPTQFGCRRIANLTGQVGYGLTDALMSMLNRSFGPTARPTKFIMGTRSGQQLAASRQATSVNVMLGAGPAITQTFNTYPPPPDDWNGTPIIYADNAIDEIEAIEA